MADDGSWDAGGSGNNTYGNRSNHSGHGYNDRRRGGGGPRRYENSNNYSHGGGGNDSASGGGDVNTKIVYVQTASRGSIIGAQGSVIREMEQSTGAKIQMDRSKRGYDQPRETEVKIVGSNDAIQRAWEAIQNTVGANNCHDGASSSNHDGERHRDQRRPDNRYRNDNDSSYGPRNFSRSNRGRDNNDDNDSFENGNYSDRNRRFNDNRSSRNRWDNSAQPESNSRANAPSSSDQNYSSGSNNDSRYEQIDYEAIYRAADEKKAAELAAMPPIVKNLYVEDPEVKSMSSSEVQEFRTQNMNISVSRVLAETEEQQLPIPNPVKTFEQAFRPYPEMLETIYRQKFEKPSPIQSQSWPVLLSGEDLIGIAQTGTGKTLAFLLPAMLHIEHQKVPRNERVGPTVLVLSPTRELALQIEKEINKYSYKNIKCVCVYGGGSRKDQVTALHKTKPEIIVATPGRLDDLLMACEVQLGSVTYVVLDEADKMLEMGFECQIRKVLMNVRMDRQSVMTSATWPPGVRRLATQYSNNPVQVVVGSLDLAAVHSVSQTIEVIDEEEKRDRLMEFLHEMEPDDKVIVFCGKKMVTDDIASNLILEGVKCQSLHGDREQCDREQALEDLKSGEVHILIATDLAARGLDVPDITHIFNYDFPKNIEEYVHRIGRTGRAGRSGSSISLFTRRDWANAADLIKILTEANQGIPDELIKMSERFEAAQQRKDSFPRGGGGGRFHRGSRGGGGRGGGGRYNRNNSNY